MMILREDIGDDTDDDDDTDTDTDDGDNAEQEVEDPREPHQVLLPPQPAHRVSAVPLG